MNLQAEVPIQHPEIPERQSVTWAHTRSCMNPRRAYTNTDQELAELSELERLEA